MMLTGIANRNGRKWQQLIMIAVLLAALFMGGYLLGGQLFQPASPPSSAPSNTTNRGGMARVNPPYPLSDFTLTGKDGSPVTLSALRGRAAFLFFGYTHCPDECPTTLTNFVRIKQMLGDQAQDVTFVFVSVDGERDTPEQMTTYLNHFDPAFVGMTGGEAALRSMGTEFGLVFEKQSATTVHEHAGANEAEDPALDPENYFVQHTSPAFLIDRDGVLRMLALYGTAPETIAESLRQMLQESTSDT
jgi:protein SCO1/2